MLKAHEVRGQTVEERKARLAELQRELMQERGVQAMGGSTPNPGKIRTLRREIARIHTINREIQLGIGKENKK
ncbi:MAG: 50S ribosomal protein L29 [Halobacteriales archaeon]|nr:50S ribosomal protein L29 [Halobacteriales archaeon]